MTEEQTFNALKYVIVRKNNRILYFNNKGQQHREDGPAIEREDGKKEWWVNGKLHREDGPAIEFADGTKQWWRLGVRIK